MNIHGTTVPVHKLRLVCGCLLVIAAGACAPSYRPIADTGGDAAFKYRIATTYLPGSPGERLRSDLAVNGFAVAVDASARRFSATDRPPNLPCLSETRVDWNEDRRGRITVVQASRHSCT